METPRNEYRNNVTRLPSTREKKGTTFLQSVQAHIGLAVVTLIPPLIFGAFALRDSHLDLSHTVSTVISDLRGVESQAAGIAPNSARIEHIDQQLQDTKKAIAGLLRDLRDAEKTLSVIRAMQSRGMSGMSGAR